MTNSARRAYRKGREGLAVKARRQAWAELLARHETEFRALVNEKRAELGLPPARRGRPPKQFGDE